MTPDSNKFEPFVAVNFVFEDEIPRSQRLQRQRVQHFSKRGKKKKKIVITGLPVIEFP